LLPGRPGMGLWPTTLTHVASREVGKDPKNLDEALTGLAKAFSVRPFGDPAQVAKSATESAKRVQTLIDSLAERDFDANIVNQTRAYLADFDGEKYPDYDSARQRAWAYFMVTQEQHWTKELRDRNAKELYRSRLTEFSQHLKGGLLLTLPS